MDLVQAIINGGGGLALIIMAYRVRQLEAKEKTLEKNLKRYRREFYKLKGITITLITIVKSKRNSGINGQFDDAIKDWDKFVAAKEVDKEKGD